MTVEHRLRFGLSDILAVVCECKNCGFGMSLPPEKIRVDKVNKCAGCSVEWIDLEGEGRHEPTVPIAKLLAALGPAIKREGELRVNVLLEFAAPK